MLRFKTHRSIRPTNRSVAVSAANSWRREGEAGEFPADEPGCFSAILIILVESMTQWQPSIFCYDSMTENKPEMNVNV